MRIARFSQGNDPRYAVVDGETGHEVLRVITGDPIYTPVQETGEVVPITDDVRLLAPVIPRSKIVGVGRNYADHVKEMGNEVPTTPLLFFKPNTAVIGPGDAIVRPPQSERTDYEGELAAVIGRVTKNVSVADALDHVFGYTISNDVTARVPQLTDR